MLSLVGIVVIGFGLAAAAASLRGHGDVPRLERWGGGLFLAGAVLLSLGLPHV
ncbi:MAG TPA: hypothetical protein VLV50_08320 [Stellaceae bacterium]|nr:hypothetical protein [Stellaceae bacterium]